MRKHPHTHLNNAQTQMYRAFEDRGVLSQHPPNTHLTPTSLR